MHTLQDNILNLVNNLNTINAENLLTKYITLNQWQAAKNFIKILPHTILKESTIIQLADASLEAYWQRNITNYNKKAKTTAKEITNITYIADLTNNSMHAPAMQNILIASSKEAPNILTIKCCAIELHYRIEESIKLFKTLIHNDSIAPYISILKACAKHNDVISAREIFNKIPAKYLEHPEYYTACQIHLQILLNNNIELSKQFITTLENNNKINAQLYWQAILHLGVKGEDITAYIEKAEKLEFISETHPQDPEIQLSESSYLEIISNETTDIIQTKIDYLLEHPNSQKLKQIIDSSNINYDKLILLFGTQLVQIFAANNSSTEIANLYYQSNKIQTQAMTLAILDYAIENKIYDLYRVIKQQLPTTSTDYTLKCYLLKMHLLEGKWQEIFQIVTDMDNHPNFIEQQPLLTKILKRAAKLRFNALGFKLINLISNTNHNLELRNAALEFLSNNTCSINFAAFPLSKNSYQYFQNIINEERNFNVNLYQQMVTNSFLEIQLTGLIYAARYQEQLAIQTINRLQISAAHTLYVAHMFNPLYIKLHKYIYTYYTTNQAVIKHYMLNLLANGLWEEALNFYNNLDYQTIPTEKSLLKITLALYGLEAVTKQYNAMKTLYMQNHNNNMLVEISATYLEILISQQKYTNAITVYNFLETENIMTEELMSLGLSIFSKQQDWAKFITTLNSIYVPQAIQYTVLNNEISIANINNILKSIKYISPTNYFVEIFILLKQKNYQTIRTFIAENRLGLNQDCYNYIIFSAIKDKINPLPWLKITPIEFRDNTFYITLALDWIKSQPRRSSRIDRLLKQIQKSPTKNNISIQLKIAQIMVKFDIAWQPMSMVSSFSIALLQYSKKHNLRQIFNYTNPKKSYFNRIFTWHCIKLNAIELIEQLYNLNTLANIKLLIQLLLKAKKPQQINNLLNKYDITNKAIWLLKAAIMQNNTPQMIQTLKIIQPQTINTPEESNTIQTALSKIWGNNHIKKLLSKKFHKNITKTPEKTIYSEAKESKELYPLTDATIIYQNPYFVTQLDFKKIQIVLREMLNKHNQGITGFDFNQIRFSYEYNRVKLSYDTAITTQATDIYNFAKWCLKIFTIENQCIDVINFDKIKHNIDEELYLLIVQCTHKDPNYRPNLQELIDKFAEPNQALQLN